MLEATKDKTQIAELHENIIELVKGVVRNPDEVSVSRKDFSSLLALTIKAAQDDVRRVLGSRGKHFKALDTICHEAMKSTGLELQLIIDEQPGFQNPNTSERAKSFGRNEREKLQGIDALLQRVVALLVSNPSKLSVTSTEIGSTIILELFVAEEDFPLVYGKPIEFDYGIDGHLIGAIKHYFDSIGKNNGQVVRIVLNKT